MNSVHTLAIIEKQKYKKIKSLFQRDFISKNIIICFFLINLRPTDWVFMFFKNK